MDAVTYLVLEPFRQALASIRSGILAAGLRIAQEWDVTYNLHQDYGVSLSHSRILTVYNSLDLLHNIEFDAAYALASSVSLAVCDAGGHARVAVRGQQRRLVDQVVAALRQSGARQLAPRSAA